MDNQIRRELRLLKGYALFTTVILSALMLSAFRQQKQQFGEIDVERINIVEPDGKLRMMISNRPRLIGPIYKGEPFGHPGGGRPGIIFFNDEGTENGGLTFTGRRNADGRYQATSGFSFDQVNQDQMLYFQYNDNNGTQRMGFTIADRADRDVFEMVKERDSIQAAHTDAFMWAGPCAVGGGEPVRSRRARAAAHGGRLVRHAESRVSRRGRGGHAQAALIAGLRNSTVAFCHRAFETSCASRR